MVPHRIKPQARRRSPMRRRVLAMFRLRRLQAGRRSLSLLALHWRLRARSSATTVSSATTTPLAVRAPESRASGEAMRMVRLQPDPTPQQTAALALRWLERARLPRDIIYRDREAKAAAAGAAAAKGMRPAPARVVWAPIRAGASPSTPMTLSVKRHRSVVQSRHIAAPIRSALHSAAAVDFRRAARPRHEIATTRPVIGRTASAVWRGGRAVTLHQAARSEGTAATRAQASALTPRRLVPTQAFRQAVQPVAQIVRSDPVAPVPPRAADSGAERIFRKSKQTALALPAAAGGPAQASPMADASAAAPSAVATAASVPGSRRPAASQTETALVLAPPVLDRIADDVMHRLERRMRIERERRGL